jgi:glycosylphosphatidylinositol transamidase (GPIT) subunit GPI8
MSLIITDKYIAYNLEDHMYYPLPALLQDKLNYDIHKTIGEKEGNIWLEDIAWFIKDFCIAYGDKENVFETTKKIEYMIYLNAQDQVKYLKRAYVEVVRYALNDEGDHVGSQTGLNVIKGQIIPVEELRGRRELSARLERILLNSGLLFKGIRTWSIPTTVTRGTDY